MPNVGYHIDRIFTPWCQNSYHKAPIFNRKTYSIAMGTNHHLAAILKSGPTWPQGILSHFFQDIHGYVYLQTFLLNDL